MFQYDKEYTTIYKVVLNHEEQYSIWPSDHENPLGWKDAGKQGLKQECLDYSNLAPGNMDVKTTTTCKVGKVFNIE